MQINIEKRQVYLILAVCVFLAAATITIAYGGTNPNVMGHNSGEINVNVGTTDNPNVMTLQEAINRGYLSGGTGGGATCSWNLMDLPYSPAQMQYGWSYDDFLTSGATGICRTVVSNNIQYLALLSAGDPQEHVGCGSTNTNFYYYSCA